jgi:hypothetical protein
VVEVDLSIPLDICGEDVTDGEVWSSNCPTEAPRDWSSRRGAASEMDQLGVGAAPLSVDEAVACAGRGKPTTTSWPCCGVSTGRMCTDGPTAAGEQGNAQTIIAKGEVEVDGVPCALETILPSASDSTASTTGDGKADALGDEDRAAVIGGSGAPSTPLTI